MDAAARTLQRGLGCREISRRSTALLPGKLIEPAMLARYRANAEALHNRAVFEIPEMLQQIFDLTETLP